ncbi:MAG TPA: AMP-binding protein [Burkholderiaceae bacterium]|nr:AMP-binding protein [Burkholderiaceae bacterium]
MTADLLFASPRPLSRSGATIDERASRLAGGLAALGMEDGDVIAVMLRNDPVFADMIRACRVAGCFYCPINWHFKADEVLHLLNDSGAKLLLIHADLHATIAAQLPPSLPVLLVDPSGQSIQAPLQDQPGAPQPGASASSTSRIHRYEAWLARQTPYAGPTRNVRGHMAYTSGTTGRPKGVRRQAVPAHEREQQLAAMRTVVAATFGIRPEIRTLVSAPLYHSAPSLFAQQALDQGSLMVLAPRFDAGQTLELIERYRIETVFLVPIMFVRLLRLPDEVRRRHDLSSLRFVACTGAPCPPEVKRAMLDWWGPVIYETYASSETGMITVQDPESARSKPGSAGRPVGGARLKIVADDGRECAPGEIGRIFARQPAFPDFEYVNNAPARAAVERDGLVTLGDIGWVDNDGYLFLCDRATDMVISGGVNIYPAEIEHMLLAMPEVADCAVFGVPDDEYGQSLVAVIAAAKGTQPDIDRIRTHLRAHLANYKVPRAIEFRGELPRDDNGKIAKHRLRESWLAEHAASRRTT